MLENLGATLDAYDCLDFSDNEIVKFENFPVLKQLRTVLLNNNQVARIEAGLGPKLPVLDTLILTNNRISSLGEVDHLSSIASLTSLSLLRNPVTKREHYRLYTIHRLPHLKVLDFSKIKPSVRVSVRMCLCAYAPMRLCVRARMCACACAFRSPLTCTFPPTGRLQERKEAARLFASESGRELENKVAKAKTFTPGVPQAADAEEASGFTPEQLAQIKERLDAATTAEELERVESFLKQGKMPPLPGVGAGAGAAPPL